MSGLAGKVTLVTGAAGRRAALFIRQFRIFIRQTVAKPSTRW
jgi:hypothetical protein